MKKKSISRLLFVLSFISFTFYGCQKEISDQNGSANFTAVVLSSKVNNWLDKQQAQAATGRKEKIRQLQQNLDFDKLHIETLNSSEQLIIVPVRIEYKTINNKDNPVSNTAVFILDKAGEIRQGNVMQYASGITDSDNSLPNNTIAKIYNNQKIEGSGKFTLLSVYDKFEYELTYKAGNLQSTGYMQPNAAANGRTSSCIAWYLVTTTFYSDGSQETTETFLGTTCYESGCYPNDPNLQSLDCIEPGSGNGGDAVVLLTSIVEVDSVVNSLTDTCLRAAFNMLTSDKLKNQLNKLYLETFVGIGKKHNLEIVQVPHIYVNGVEVASASHVKSNDANTWVIEMSGSLDYYPLEIFGNMISHEMIHGFLQMNNLDFTIGSVFADSHKEMLDRWIIQTKELLTEAFGMPANDALALSLTGYDDVLRDRVTGQFKQGMSDWIASKYSINLNQAEQISDQYFNKLKGTVCH
jgi:hypothetical protein